MMQSPRICTASFAVNNYFAFNFHVLSNVFFSTFQVILWVSWFSVLGFLHLMSQLSKDRFEYVSTTESLRLSLPVNEDQSVILNCSTITVSLFSHRAPRVGQVHMRWIGKGCVLLYEKVQDIVLLCNLGVWCAGDNRRALQCVKP